MTKDDKITWGIGFLWVTIMFALFIAMTLLSGCKTAQPCEPEIKWKEKLVIKYEECPCLTDEIQKPDLVLLKVVDWSVITDEQAANMIKHDNGELVKYAVAMRIACDCKEGPK